MATRFNIHHEQMFYFYHRDSSFTASPTDNIYRSQVTFKFSLKSTISDWFSGPIQFQLSPTIHQPAIKTYVLVNFDDEIEKVREIIDKELRSWPVEPVRVTQMIDAALSKAREMVECLSPQDSYSIHLHFRAEAFNFRIFSGIEGDGVRMVPTVESSIESLNKKKVMDCGTYCSVCLEEILIGSEGTLMPCLHIFHGDCIKKWLRTSHYCPVCRFEMPKDE